MKSNLYPWLQSKIELWIMIEQLETENNGTKTNEKSQTNVKNLKYHMQQKSNHNVPTKTE